METRSLLVEFLIGLRARETQFRGNVLSLKRFSLCTFTAHRETFVDKLPFMDVSPTLIRPRHEVELSDLIDFLVLFAINYTQKAP